MAQGTLELSGVTFSGGKGTAEIELFAPPTPVEGVDPDPDTHGDAWVGEASFYSVAISPQSVTTSDDIKARAGLGFKEGKNTFYWDDTKMDISLLRPQDFQAIFDRIICKDNAINHP